ncbi:Bug family tripartite tricarboxylate transporter substrate binding protein [Sabulicella glaciei]|uniref:Tripartite tricarboxylate transporter substrate binding protein n=1 Tax=Sabulicella glaciei TaxID=2984948 RepID=A0ABT3NVI4_9PROT|nr:tripartite tricarboxylate transporter substrate binding protein [Roseococcus sp. MDT2-1-1]MCW8085569.1 tripartite tricarboxylate transporter substrate binding protein [Roseococcus sp. MDT2-1-1]
MMHPWKPILAAALLLAAGLANAPAAGAQEAWPQRPIRMIVPFPPGGGTDTLARIVATRLQTVLGQPVAVENRSGGSGVIGTEAVARAAPDGYTLAMTASGPMTILPQMMPNPPYDPVRSFEHVALPSATPLFMVVQPAFPARSASEFVTWARQNRGRVNYCSIGVASPSHLVAEIFRQRFDLEMEHIPHRGSAPALTDAMAGNCHVLFDSGTSASPLVRQGSLRALGVSAARRMPSFPDLPTIAEQSAPGFEASTWSAVIAPAGTPAPIVERLNTEIRRLIATPAEQERIAAQGGLPLDLTPAQFTAFLEREIRAWGQVIRAGNIRID